MANPSTNLMVAESGSGVCVRIIGRADFTASLDFKALVNGLWDKGRKQYLLDLSKCLIMDSTFLGVVAGFAMKVSRGRAAGEAACVGIYQPSQRVRDLLDNLGVLGLFQEVTAPEVVPGEMSEVAKASDGVSKVEVARNCLEAHRILMEINPANMARFKDVAKFMEEDLQRLTGNSP